MMKRQLQLYSVRLTVDPIHGFFDEHREQTVVASTAEEAIEKCEPDSDEYPSEVRILSRIDIP